MKTKVLLAVVTMAFSLAMTSCGNKKAAEDNSPAKCEQVCGATKSCGKCDLEQTCCKKDSTACCRKDSANCPKKGECPKSKCDKPCEKK